MGTLRRACPWDRVQTHASLRRHLLEETYETLEALDEIARTDPARVPAGTRDASADAPVAGGSVGDASVHVGSVGDASADASVDGAMADLCEELGDLIFQVVFHSHLAAEAGAFDLAEVIDGVRTKLVGRHPAIFGADDTGRPDGDPLAWERAKVAEKDRASVMDGIPPTLPALAYASKVIGKARAVAPGTVAGLVADDDEVPADGLDAASTEASIGRALLELTAAARVAGIDAESALRTAAHGLETRVRAAEQAS